MDIFSWYKKHITQFLKFSLGDMGNSSSFTMLTNISHAVSRTLSNNNSISCIFITINSIYKHTNVLICKLIYKLLDGLRTSHYHIFFRMDSVLVSLGVLCCAVVVNAYKTGAPPRSCASMVPGHEVAVQTGASPYRITMNSSTYVAGDVIAGRCREFKI